MAWYSWVPMLLAQAGDAAAKTDESQLPPGMKLLAAVGILVGSFVLGHFIAKGLRLPDFSVRIGFVLFDVVRRHRDLRSRLAAEAGHRSEWRRRARL